MLSSEAKYRNCLFDLIGEITSKALEAKKKLDHESFESRADKDYVEGYLFALFDVLSVAEQQAEVFDIGRKEMNLSDIRPESDLL
ncbi:hypothetical protein PsAD13_00062 [Pseudovibrio sp. Ad13]|uniref:hypothetical protein n=1 Tax=Pseudovibrio sp. Ad13 TaxID=989396 RepID=UPI0007AEC20D|nr:hypothetical protein [Pseudovibrio sp. Ad13]KZK88117.1 hypothetical protein PsAD13_00062 [Pseudovibrio sp. Ad13]